MDKINFQKKHFENEYIKMHVEDGILYAEYKNGVIITLVAAKKILEDRLSFTKELYYPFLIDGRGVKYWTKEAREFQSTKENNVGLKAIAMFIDSQALKIIVKFYLLINEPSIPQACFTNLQKAQKWIQQFK